MKKRARVLLKGGVEKSSHRLSLLDPLVTAGE